MATKVSYFGMWRSLVWQILTAASEEYAASIFALQDVTSQYRPLSDRQHITTCRKLYELTIHGRDSSVGIATSYRLDGRVQFSGISTFSIVNFSYVLFTSLCIHVFAFCTYCINVTYSVLLMYYCFRIVHCLCNTATGHKPNSIW
jgi:hypothetical protein